MSEFSLIKLDDFKEASLLAIADNIIGNIESGEVKPLPAFIQAKALDFLSKEIIKRTKDLAMEEAADYGKDNVFNGASFGFSTSGTLLNYEDDEEYKEIQKTLKARQSKLKKAFEMHKDGDIYVDGTGEVVPVVSIKKHGEQIIKVSFK